MREGPWGSHHDEASALKWETSSGDTVVKAGSDELGVGVSETRRQDVDAKERKVGVRDDEDMGPIGVGWRLEVMPLGICLIGDGCRDIRRILRVLCLKIHGPMSGTEGPSLGASQMKLKKSRNRTRVITKA